MKVLLIKDVKSLGKAGEIKELKPGYGQNFLIKKGFAKLATDEVIKEFEATQEQKAQELKAEIKELETVKEKLGTVATNIQKKLGDTGHLFGAVTKDEIAHEIKKQNSIEVDKKQIEISSPIKTIGKHDIQIKLGHGVVATTSIEVIAE